jgi:hypothetical protein
MRTAGSALTDAKKLLFRLQMAVIVMKPTVPCPVLQQKAEYAVRHLNWDGAMPIDPAGPLKLVLKKI